MRTFERTHPWIDFRLDLKAADYRLWILLGEAQSKAMHLADTPLMPDVRARLLQVALARGALATTAIEGNTLTEEQALDLVRNRPLSLPASQDYLGVEIRNVLEGCSQIASAVRDGSSLNLSVDRILEFNRTVLEDLPLGEDVVPGEIRMHPVQVGGVYGGAPAEDCEFLLERLCKWLPEIDRPSGNTVGFGIIRAILAHIYIAWIHPFGDGNGRTARLVELQIMMSVGVPATTAHLLSNHYNQTRSEYYRRIDATHRKSSGEGVMEFIQYALQGLVDQLRDQIAEVKESQREITWINFVHERFRSEIPNQVTSRRRRLVLAISAARDVVPVHRIADLTPDLSRDYAVRTKMIRRDLNHVINMGLLEERGAGRIAPMRRIISAMEALRFDFEQAD